MDIHILIYKSLPVSGYFFLIVRVIAQSAMAPVIATACNTERGTALVLEFTYAYTYTYTWILSCPRLRFPSCVVAQTAMTAVMDTA